MAKRRRGNGSGSLFKRRGIGPWVMSYHDHTGKRVQRSTGTTDKAAAQRILSKHLTDTALRHEGVVDAKADGYSQADRRPPTASGSHRRLRDCTTGQGGYTGTLHENRHSRSQSGRAVWD